MHVCKFCFFFCFWLCGTIIQATDWRKEVKGAQLLRKLDMRTLPQKCSPKRSYYTPGKEFSSKKSMQLIEMDAIASMKTITPLSNGKRGTEKLVVSWKREETKKTQGRLSDLAGFLRKSLQCTGRQTVFPVTPVFHQSLCPPSLLNVLPFCRCQEGNTSLNFIGQ